MTNMGIVRRIDDLGRIVIPRDIRHSLNLDENALLAFSVEKDKLMLTKYQPETPKVDFARIVREHRGYFTSVMSYEDYTVVVLRDGVAIRVKRYYRDEYDLNKAIAYALRKTGIVSFEE